MYGAGGVYGGGMGGMYGGMGGMYGGGMGGPGMLGPGASPQGPPAPPSGWQAMLRALSAGMEFFGRVTMLMDENVHAVNILISGVLMLFDRGGSLYAEVARFVLRLLGVRIPPGLQPPPPPGPPVGPDGRPLALPPGGGLPGPAVSGALSPAPPGASPAPGAEGAKAGVAPSPANFDAIWEPDRGESTPS